MPETSNARPYKLCALTFGDFLARLLLATVSIWDYLHSRNRCNVEQSSRSSGHPINSYS